jgi:cobalamin biosynthesis protein CobD/CbiB
MAVRKLPLISSLAVLLLGGPVRAAAIPLIWSGSMIAVLENTGTGQLRNVTEGTPSAGGFLYASVPGIPEF